MVCTVCGVGGTAVRAMILSVDPTTHTARISAGIAQTITKPTPMPVGTATLDGVHPIGAMYTLHSAASAAAAATWTYTGS
jgi:hypothetical protein